jgi:hypothetical protein
MKKMKNKSMVAKVFLSALITISSTSKAMDVCTLKDDPLVKSGLLQYKENKNLIHLIKSKLNLPVNTAFSEIPKNNPNLAIVNLGTKNEALVDEGAMVKSSMGRYLCVKDGISRIEPQTEQIKKITTITRDETLIPSKINQCLIFTDEVSISEVAQKLTERYGKGGVPKRPFMYKYDERDRVYYVNSGDEYYDIGVRLYEKTGSEAPPFMVITTINYSPVLSRLSKCYQEKEAPTLSDMDKF